MSELRIYLRGVDLADLSQRYLAGEFRHVTEPIPLTKISVAQPIKGVCSAISEVKSHQVEISGQIFACIGYKVYEKDGRYGNYIPEGGYRCMQCLRKITGQSMGIPIYREEKGKIIYYHMIDIFCCFRCIYTELDRRRHNSLYTNSMTYLGEIYEKVTGRSISELQLLSDRRLLRMFNGPMTWTEYHADTKIYPEKPGTIYFLPVPEYLEQESSK